MSLRKRTYWFLALTAIAALVAIGATLGSGPGSNGSAAQIDDGAELLPLASITLEDALAAAQAAYGGQLGAVDLEMFEGRLVFNVDVGPTDVKVDAGDATVLGAVSDD